MPSIALSRCLNVLRLVVLFVATLIPVSFAQADGGNDNGNDNGNDDVATTESKGHFQAGTTHYNLGRFEDAIGEYRKAYELKNDPVFLFNIAQSYRQLGHAERALFFYRRYLSTAPESPHRNDVQTRIDELEKQIKATPAARAEADPIAMPPSVPQPANQPEALLVEPQESVANDQSVVHTWWFWSAVGAVVVVGGAALVLALSAEDNDVPKTTLGNWDVRVD
ncbi:MAG: tetratricopeptide repeat protein [Deltaproteobacteria bacterium]|nr:tetratricopeptide repeat protein [Deltaproteobacteria bacterium]